MITFNAFIANCPVCKITKIMSRPVDEDPYYLTSALRRLRQEGWYAGPRGKLRCPACKSLKAVPVPAQPEQLVLDLEDDRGEESERIGSLFPMGGLRPFTSSDTVL